MDWSIWYFELACTITEGHVTKKWPIGFEYLHLTYNIMFYLASLLTDMVSGRCLLEGCRCWLEALLACFQYHACNITNLLSCNHDFVKLSVINIQAVTRWYSEGGVRYFYQINIKWKFALKYFCPNGLDFFLVLTNEF